MHGGEGQPDTSKERRCRLSIFDDIWRLLWIAPQVVDSWRGLITDHLEAAKSRCEVTSYSSPYKTKVACMRIIGLATTLAS
jgi:hypothetical protein